MRLLGRAATKRRAISGIVAALILFVMLFTVGTGYFLWINTNNGSYSLAQAGRNQAIQNQQSESVLLSTSLVGGVLQFIALNQGGLPVNITNYYVNSNIGLVCQNIIKKGFTTCPTAGSGPGPIGVVLNPGSLAYSQSTGYNCASPPCGVSNPVTVEVLTARGNVFTAAYPPPSAGVCSGGTFTPSLSTALSPSSPITAGTSEVDTASLMGGCNPTGNFVFKAYSSSSCTGSPAYTSNAIVVSGNGPYSSVPSFAANSVGTYYWAASYSGDGNNVGVSSTCGSEFLTVNKASPTVVTLLSASSVPAGSTVSDSATLGGSSGNNAGGSVSYYWYSGGTCSGGSTLVSTATVTNGLIPSSAAVTFNTVGAYSWQAAYTGDSNNNAATSTCEPLSVTASNGQTQLPLAIQLNSFRFLCVAATNCASGDGSAVAGYFGYVVPTSGSPSPGPNLVFQINLENVDPMGRTLTVNAFSLIYITLLTCNVSGNNCAKCASYATYVVGTPIDSQPWGNNLVAIPAYSAPFTSIPYLQTSTLYFGAATPGASGSGAYIGCPGSGNPTLTYYEAQVAPFITGNYQADESPFSLTLPFTAIYGTPVYTSSCTPSASGIPCSVPLGGTGTVNFGELFGTTAFNSPPKVFIDYTNGGAGTSLTTSSCGTNSCSFTIPSNAPLTAGSYYMIYATDGTNIAYATLHALSGTSISTSLTQSSIVHGNAVSDSASISGSTGNAGGSVTYYYYSNGACSVGQTAVNTVTVTNGAVPNSQSHAFAQAGAYSWNAVYSGDANNGGATSACEALTVTTSLTINPASINHATSHTVTLTASSLETSPSYSYCLSTSSTSITCVSSSLASPSPGTFTSTGGGAIPAATTIVTTSSITPGTYYVVIYQGSQIVGFATLTVT